MSACYPIELPMCNIINSIKQTDWPSSNLISTKCTTLSPTKCPPDQLSMSITICHPSKTNIIWEEMRFNFNLHIIVSPFSIGPFTTFPVPISLFALFPVIPSPPSPFLTDLQRYSSFWPSVTTLLTTNVSRVTACERRKFKWDCCLRLAMGDRGANLCWHRV